MGSKNLKAIAVRGTKGVGNIRDFKAFMAATVAGKKVLHDNAVTGQGLPTYGTRVLMNVINEVGALPTAIIAMSSSTAPATFLRRLWTKSARPTAKPVLSPTRPASGVRSHVAVSRSSTKPILRRQPPLILGRIPFEYEAAWALGAVNGVNDLEALTYANFVCNEDGFDPISFGATAGAVMELYEMPALTSKEIGIEADGVELISDRGAARQRSRDASADGRGMPPKKGPGS
jgi:aldehyde:ferredoxin oxidoreductase